MKIAFLIIGSEVLDGKIADLNTKSLAEFLRPESLEIGKALIVRDEKESIIDALKSLSQNHDVVITSGGLGPTKDDITKECLGEFLGRKLLYNEESHKISEINYKKFDRPFPGKEHGYCYLPEGFVPLLNSTGFAPAFFVEFDNKFLISGPGVPREFTSLLTDHFKNIVGKLIPQNQFINAVIARTKGIPEEKIFGEVDTTLWQKLEVHGEVSSLPNVMGVDIGVKIRATSQSEIAEKAKAVRDIFEASPVKKSIWHFGRETVEEKIVTLANQKKIRYGFAESATGGLCSHRLTSISGSSQSFMGSVVCYDEKVKEHILGVRESTLQNFTAVSPECAEEMSAGLAKNLSVDIAISVTGFAGPSGGNDKYPVGTVIIGRTTHGKTSHEIFSFKGNRELLKLRFSQVALYALLDEVENFA